MRIIALCGSLEPGRDGVGDYTRRLVAELIVQKHKAIVIAINDGATTTVLHETQHCDDIPVPVLRLPAQMSAKERQKIAKSFIAEFNPEFISLQYVPFAFHDKGLPFGLGSFLKQMGNGRKWHIMFHEIWLVSKSYLPTKRVLTGNLQRLLIKQLVKKLQPVVIHTQTQLSRHHLSALGFSAKILPLFSNIMVRPAPKSAGSDAEKNNQITLVSFGSIYPNALIEQFAGQAADYQQKAGKQIKLVIAGRSGPLQQHWVNAWQNNGLEVELLGELPFDKISEVLSAATFGLSSTPFVMSEKSGAVAAMREHRLPVICLADPYMPKGFHFQPPGGIIEYSKAGFEECITFSPKYQHSNNVSFVAHQIVQDLQPAGERADRQVVPVS